jgi:phage terminase small subunit
MRHVLPNLNPQQIRFCEEYLVSFNAYRAAKAAGYSENSAKKGELLHLPKIEAYLKLKQQERAERLEISHDKILREYAKIAFANMGNYYDERGDVKPMCELSESDKAAMSFIQSANIAEPDGYVIGRVTKIKLHNKMAALDRIAKHLGFFEAGKRVAGGELPVAGLEKEVAVAGEIQESRTKNQDEGQIEEIDIAAVLEEMDAVEEAFVQEEVYESAEENEDGLLRDRPVQKEEGKALTFSPLVEMGLSERSSESLVNGSSGYTARETLAVG